MSELQAPTADSTEPFKLPALSRQGLGWLLFGGGVAGTLVTLFRGRRRRRWEWALHLGLLGAGASILLKRRQARIVQAEESILAELEGLDPVARAQVLKAVADQQLARFLPARED